MDKPIGDYKNLLKEQNSKHLSKIEDEVTLLENKDRIEKNSFQQKATFKTLDVKIALLSESKIKYEIQYKYAEYMIESNEKSSQENEKYKKLYDEAKNKLDDEKQKIHKTTKYLDTTSKTLKSVKILSDVIKDISDTKKIGNEEIRQIKEKIEKKCKLLSRIG